MCVSENVKKQASMSPGRTVFNVEENTVGPGDYNPQKNYKKGLNTLIKETVSPEPAVGSMKQ